MSKKQPARRPAAAKPSQEAAPKPASDFNIFTPWIPVVLAVLLYATGLANGMVDMDDHTATTDNPAVKDFSIANLVGNFNLGMYAPLTWLVYALIYAVAKDSAFLYHLASLVFHAANTYLIFRLFRRLEGDERVAFFVALLFAVHPIQIESVSWIAAFSTPFFTFFSLLSCHAYLSFAHDEEAKRNKNYALALGFFLLACLAKTTAVTLPLLLVLFDFWKKPDFSNQKKWLGYVPFFLVSLGFGALTIYSRVEFGTANAPMADVFAPLERVVLLLWTPIFYILKTLLPLDLNIYYTFPKPLPAHFYAGAVGLLVLVFAAWRWRNAAPFFALGLAFFLANIAVQLPFAPLGAFELCADHYNYLASAGIFFVLVRGLGWLGERFSFFKNISTPAAAAWVVVIFAGSFFQIKTWKNTLSLLSNAIENGHTQRGYLVFSRGIEFGDLNQPQPAIADFTKAIELNPTLKDAYKFRGSLHAQAQNLDAALTDLKKYASLDSTDVVVWNNLAMIYMRKQRLPESLDAFNRTIALNPNAAISYQNRSKIYDLLGNTAAAEADRAKAKELAK